MWCCPRCQRANFKSHMGVLGHMRSCSVEDMMRPVVLGEASAPLSSKHRPSMEDAPPWFASAMLRLDARLASSEARVQQLERYTGNHLTHARIQLAGAGGASSGAGLLGNIKTEHIILAVVVIGAFAFLSGGDRTDGLKRGAEGLQSLARMGTAVKTLKGFLG